MMHATLVRRREAALKGKREKKLKALAEQPYDDRAYAMSVHLIRTLPKDELHALSPEQFTQRVRSHLYQLDLGLERESGPLIITDFLPCNSLTAARRFRARQPAQTCSNFLQF